MFLVCFLVVMICQTACDHRRPCSSFLTNSFFSCKDRALERDRPYQRKKKVIPVHIAHATFSIGLLVKKGGQHGRPMTSLSYRTTRATRWMACPSPRLLYCVIVSCWGWGSFVSVFGGSRLERCQSTSRHGTCRCYAQSSR